jgi:hypothetical protein
MRPLLIACALLLLTGSHAGYGPPLRAECVDTGEVGAFMVMVRDPREIARMHAQMPDRDHGAVVRAFTGITKDGKYTLVLPALRGQKDAERLEAWGHELAHIVCGKFHGPPDAR